MHIKAKKMAFGGLLLALSVICMILGSVIETGTLFLLAAASFFVGIIFREFGRKTAAAFYVAGVLLGLILAPNKLYVATYGMMGFFILTEETAWERLSGWNAGVRKKSAVLWGIRYAVFDLIYVPAVLFFQKLLFARTLPFWATAGILAVGQADLWLYVGAYGYVQRELWGKLRGHIFQA